MAAVVLKDIVKKYANGIQVVHGMNLEIKDGEFMVLVGPSGCGKSTTLRMIAGLEEISSGLLSIGGRQVNDLEPKNRNIAMVFQNYALYPHMTVYENISFGLKLSGMSKEETDSRVHEVAQTLEIEHLLQRKPKDMSGGQRQRVALGRAIARRAEVYLFDEPLSNLDAQLRVSMRVRLAQLHQDLKSKGLSHTMIYVTHDQTEAMTLGHRICVMEAGYIRQVDSPLNLYKYPANKFVAEFIGSPSINFAEGLLQKKGGKFYVDAQGYHAPISQNRAQFLEPYIGQKVGMGIRAEHIRFSPDPIEEAFSAPVKVAERMGNEDFLYFPFGSSLFVARGATSEVDSYHGKDSYSFIFDPENIMLFDMETELNLTLPEGRFRTDSSENPRFDYLKEAEHLLEYLGGKENIVEINNCITRLRLQLKNIGKMRQDQLTALKIGYLLGSGNRVQITVGKDATEFANKISILCKGR